MEVYLKRTLKHRFGMTNEPSREPWSTPNKPKNTNLASWMDLLGSLWAQLGPGHQKITFLATHVAPFWTHKNNLKSIRISMISKLPPFPF